MKIKNYDIHFDKSNNYTRLYWGSLLPTIMYARDVNDKENYTIIRIKFMFLKHYVAIVIIKNVENLPF